MNQTVINSIYPTIVPMIAKANGDLPTVDVYAGMGGTPTWAVDFPDSCVLDSPWSYCADFCDEQSCDQCHPNDVGYALLANIVHDSVFAAKR